MLKLVNPAVVREVMKLQRAQLVEEATKVGLEEFPGLVNMLGTYDMICDDVDRILCAMPDAPFAPLSDERADIAKYWRPLRALYSAAPDVVSSVESQAQNRRGDPETAPDMAGTAAADSGVSGAQR